ncbi:MAG: hydrogenase maturation protease [Planctomycetota bacterium]
MARVLVIGFGNRLRGDDAAGPLAVERVAEACRDDNSIRCMPRPQLPPELGEDLSEVETVIFLDADAEAEPGTIRRREVHANASGSLATCHSLSPAQLCTLCRSVYGSAPRAVLLSIGAENLDYGDELSASVEEALPRLAEQAGALVRELSGEGETGGPGMEEMTPG